MDEPHILKFALCTFALYRLEMETWEWKMQVKTCKIIAYLYVCCITRINLNEHIHMQIAWKEKVCLHTYLCIMLTLHWPQHNIYVNRHPQLQTKVTLFFPVHSSHRLQKYLGSKTPQEILFTLKSMFYCIIMLSLGCASIYIIFIMFPLQKYQIIMHLTIFCRVTMLCTLLTKWIEINS